MNFIDLDMLTSETALVREPYARWCERSRGVSPSPTRCAESAEVSEMIPTGFIVILGLDPGIQSDDIQAWIPGSSPRMTVSFDLQFNAERV